jgi:DNA polymerase-2
LPALIDEYFAERIAAIDRGDDAAAFVYKILMNSFYGVLGSEKCKYAHTELAGAITSFGKMCLHFARDFFVHRGYRVLYGIRIRCLSK